MNFDDRELLLRAQRKLERRQRERNQKYHDLALARHLDLRTADGDGRPRKRRARQVLGVTVSIPPVFSFLDNPDETLSTINELRTKLHPRAVRSVFIDHSKCKALGAC